MKGQTSINEVLYSIITNMNSCRREHEPNRVGPFYHLGEGKGKVLCSVK